MYLPEYCDMVIDWFRAKPLPSEQSQDNREAVQQTYATMPTFQGFAAHIGVSTKVLYDWQNRHAAFSEACACAKDVQSQWFISGLNSGAMNPTGAIFVAKNILGWTDKQQIETTVKPDDNDATNTVKAALARATPEQLAAFAQGIQAMLANPTIPELPDHALPRASDQA